MMEKDHLRGSATVADLPISKVNYDFSKPALSFDGRPISVSSNSPSMTLGEVCIHALSEVGLQESPPDERWRRALLAEKIHSGATDLTDAEHELIKKSTGAYPPAALWAVWRFLGVKPPGGESE